MPDETLPTAGQPDESAPGAERPAEMPKVEQPDASRPAAEASDTHTAAVRLRHMVASGKVEMTAGQLLAMFDREDTLEEREEVSDGLFVEGLVARPLLEDAKYGEKVRITKVEDATPKQTKRRRTTIPLAGILVAVFLALYFHGNLDRVFYPVGLNFNECARNGLGATFCGTELDEYRRRVEAAKLKLTEAKESIEADQRKSSERAREREAELRKQADEREAEVQANAHRRRNERAEELTAKLRQERAIEEREPEGSAAYDLAHAEYEATRAEAQQLIVEAKSKESK